MTYRFRDMVAMLFIGMIIGVAIIGLTIADAKGASSGEPSYADASNYAMCISEHAYTHPRSNRFDELVEGIQWCNLGDRAMARECVAPCRVVLPKGTLEDEFGINYGWVNHRPVVKVWAKGGRR